MDTAVCSKTGNRGDANPTSHDCGGQTREITDCGYSAEKQRIYPVFEQTLRAEVFLILCFVAPRSQIRADMLRRRFAHKTKNPLSGGIHSFLRAAGEWAG